MVWRILGEVWLRWHWLCGFIILVLSESKCTITHWRENVSETRWISTATMQLRLYAMYDKSRTILVLLTTVFLTSIGSTLGLILEVVSKEKSEFYGSSRDSSALFFDYHWNLRPAFEVSSHPIPGLQICFSPSFPVYVSYFWVPTLVFEALLFILCLLKGIAYIRAYNSLTRMGAVLFRDSILYFFV